MLCKGADETVSHFIIECPALEKVRLPIHQKIDKKYKELTNNGFKEPTINEKHWSYSRLFNIIRKHKLQKLIEIEYHMRRLTHALDISRFSQLKNIGQFQP